MTLPEKECQDELLSIFNALPRHHKGTLERVVFHLARVAQKQEDNKMNPQNLAIIIAPCIIRAPDHIPPLTGKVSNLSNFLESWKSSQLINCF